MPSRTLPYNHSIGREFRLCLRARCSGDARLMVGVRRSVPEDKFLFFPILNLECDTLTPPTIGGNAAALSACSHSYRMANLVAEVDGVAVPNLDRYLVESPLFTFTLPTNNVLGLSAGTGKSVSNGAWIMLAPLEEGQHTIHFGGAFPDFPFNLDITYHLKVK